MEHMNMKAFACELELRVKEKMEFMGISAEVNLTDTIRANDTKITKLSIMADGNRCGVALDINEFYRGYVHEGADMETLATECIQTHLRHEENVRKVSQFIGESLTFEKVKDKIFHRLVNTETNKELLRQSPNRPAPGMDDLSMIYCMNFGEVAEGQNGIVRIGNEMLKSWNMTEKELYETAMENAERIYKPTIISLTDTIRAMTGGPFFPEDDFEKGDNIYVVTSGNLKCGAGAILIGEVQENLSSLYDNGRYYILPSSTDEVLAFPETADTGIEQLQEMVSQVNSECVSHEMILSNNVYRYDPKQREINTLTNEPMSKKAINIGR